MPRKSDDLWPPDIESTEVRMPVTILREQAALLGPKTQNLVEARVETRSLTAGIQHRFLLVAPALDHYTFHLFTLVHGIAPVYPARLYDLDAGTRRLLRSPNAGEVSDVFGAIFFGPNAPPPDAVLRDADALEHALQVILSADRTREIIGSLLGQSRAMAQPA